MSATHKTALGLDLGLASDAGDERQLIRRDRSLAEALQALPQGRRLIDEATLRRGKEAVITELTLDAIRNGAIMHAAAVKSEATCIDSMLETVQQFDYSPRIAKEIANCAQDHFDDYHKEVRTIIYIAMERQAKVIGQSLDPDRPMGILDRLLQ